MRYKDGIILKRTPYIIGCGFNIGEYEIQCPECGKIGKYCYDYASDRIPKYCTFCRADFEDTNLEKEIGCPLNVLFKALTNGIYTHWNWNCDLYDEEEELSYIENIYFGNNPFDKISLMFGYKKESIINLKDYKKTWWLKEDKSE